MDTVTLERVLTPELANFGKKLLEAGFKVYVFTGDVHRVTNGGRESIGTTLRFSRTVNDKECFASVSRAWAWGAHQFSMNIKPSMQNGSSMFIGGDEAPEHEDLTIANANLYASPHGYNHLVGRQENVEGWSAGYVELFG